MRARAPASSANLGPGFDVLALALSLHVEVEVAPAASLEVVTTGEGADLPQDASHLAARVATRVVGHDRLRVSVRSDIPLGRGLGSSAALAVATAAAAGSPDPLSEGAAVDGHPENAAASVRGGLVAATFVDGRPSVRSLGLDRRLRFVVLVPDRQLPTELARAAVPRQVPIADVAFNLGRLGLMIAGLADIGEMTAAAADDRLHQGQRAALFPEAPELLARMREAGALFSCWSGAGPSILAGCTAESSEGVRERGEEALAATGVAGRAVLMSPDFEGLVVER
ncbi:MAG TPA: homoserine kinase [Acidimicrobiales bacterium]|nr:homoserine kinase [Acidimicrobiales bacterium]